MVCWKDSLAQLVDHNTFNVGVLGSSPKRITKAKEEDFKIEVLLFFILINSIYNYFSSRSEVKKWGEEGF